MELSRKDHIGQARPQKPEDSRNIGTETENEKLQALNVSVAAAFSADLVVEDDRR